MTEENSEDAEALAEIVLESFDRVTARVMWDIIVSILNIDQDSKLHILEAVCKVVSDQVREDLSKHVRDLDADDFIDANDRLDRAIKTAYDEYVEYYATPILTKKFLEVITRSAVSNIVEMILDER